ncbi:MAG: imidazole glycerol phosphate synthase subunit HisH [Vicingaceae bacterium]|nr:imidazole glycerol phosphate synthase subunit HisH [Vicingaceae bacterium]
MSDKLVIIDYGMGNHFSVQKKLNQLGYDGVITNNPELISKAEKIILPGVGHFGKAMENLKRLNLIDILNKEVLQKKKPILGICLGMQLMASSSDEGNTKGLNWINAIVEKFNITDQLKYKVTHTGWNQTKQLKNSKLLNGITDSPEFYFVHTYHFKCNDNTDVLCSTYYETEFISAIERDNIFGVQFHPEKSHNIGMQLIKNFIEL